MNYYKTYSMKLVICFIALILTFSFSFANEKSKINSHNSESYPQFKKVNDIAALTLSYDVATFCAGKYGLSTPKVSEEGGVFIYTRESNGIGGLGFNKSTGQIDHNTSQSGTYKITYKKGEDSVSITITVDKCN